MVLMLNATFHNISVISSPSFLYIGGGNTSTRKKTNTDLLQVTGNLYHIMLVPVHLGLVLGVVFRSSRRVAVSAQLVAPIMFIYS